MKSSYHFFTSFMLPYFISTTVIVSYPDLEEDFLEFLSEFNYRNNEIPTFTNASSTTLCTSCEFLRRAKFFNMSLNTRLQARLFTFDGGIILPATSPRKSERYTLKLDYMTVYIGEESYKLRFLPCLINEKMGLYWYATYGFHDSYMYIFRRHPTDSDNQRLRFELLGLAEPSSAVPSQIFRSMRHIDRYFSNSYRTQDSVPSHLDVLCSLNANQQYRICAIVQDILKGSNEREFYSTTMYNHSCLEQKIVRNCKDEEIDRKKYLTPDILANLIACTFVESQTENSFFLTSDPADEFAVFVLLKDDDDYSLGTNDEIYFVIAHVRNIAVIKYSTEIY